MTKELKRTSLDLPLNLWLRVKRRALDERTDFRTLVIEALEMRLTKKPKTGRGGTASRKEKAS